jgi:WD40 repeat protein
LPVPGRIEIWDVVTNKRLKTAPFEFEEINAAAFSPDGTWLVATGGNHVAYWKWQEGDKYERLHVGRRIRSVAFSPDSRLLAEGPDSRTTLEIRDLATLKVVQAVHDERKLDLRTGGLAFADEGRTLIAGNEQTFVETVKVPHRIRLWDVKTGRLKG